MCPIRKREHLPAVHEAGNGDEDHHVDDGDDIVHVVACAVVALNAAVTTAAVAFGALAAEDALGVEGGGEREEGGGMRGG